MAILVPTLGQLFSIARRVKCATNLSHLYTAFSQRETDIRLERKDPIAIDTWVAELEPYLGDNPSALLCPDVESMEPSIPIIRMFVWGSGGPTELDYFIDLTNSYPWWNEMDCAGIQPPPGIWKVPEADLYTGGYHGEAFGIEGFRGGHSNTALLKRYSRGRRSNIYWYVLETARHGDDLYAGGDLDYDDVVVRVTANYAARRMELEPIQIWDGQDYNLVGPDGVWWPGGTRDPADSQGKSVGAKGTGGPDYFPMNTSSYGMSRYANALRAGERKIIAMDYNNPIINPGPAHPLDDGWEWLHAPRHLGECKCYWQPARSSRSHRTQSRPTAAT